MAYTYSTTVSIVESNGNAYTGKSFSLTNDNAYMVQNGYSTFGGLDILAQSGSGINVPLSVVSDRTNLAIDVAASQTTSANLTVGNTPLASMPIVMGYGGYITIPYNASIEPTGSFSVDVNGNVPTTTSGNTIYPLVSKSGVLNIAPVNNGYLITSVGGDALTGDDAMSGTNWGAETFTTTSSFSPSYVTLDLYGTITGNVNVTINTVDGSHHPTSTILTSGTLLNANIPASVTWVQIPLSPSVALSSTTQYAIVVSAPSAVIGAQLHWGIGNVQTYSGGSLNQSTNGGSTWTIFSSPVSYCAFIIGDQLYGYGTTRILKPITSGQHDINVAIKTFNGDVNRDGFVNSLDVTAIEYVILGIDPPDLSKDDVNQDGQISVGDIDAVEAIIASGSSLFLVTTIDGIPYYANMPLGITITNTNSWVLIPSPYFNSYKETLSGTEVLKYQPTFMLGNSTSSGTATFTQSSKSLLGIGTTFTYSMLGSLIKPTGDTAYYQIQGFTDATHLTLDRVYAPATQTSTYNIVPGIQDQDGYDNIGIPTWGTNPAGVALSVSSLVNSNNSGLATATVSGSNNDMVQVNTSGNGALTGNDNAMVQTNLFTPYFQPWADLTNIPVLIFLLFISTAFLIAAVVFVMKHTNNQLIGSVVLLIGESFLYKLGIYELFFVIISAIICVAIILFERKPAL
jgi:hypothetical protein